MAAVSFRIANTSNFTQSLGTGKKIVIRGNNVEDENHTVTIFGKRAGGSDYLAETLTVTSAQGQVELMSAYGYDDLTLINFAGTFDGAVEVLQEGSAGTGDIRVDTNPADGVTLTLGVTGFTKTYRFKNTTASANDVKIGASASATATNLKKAINADGAGDGSDYHTGTTAHSQFSATVASATVTITDRVKSARQLGVTLTQSSTEFSLRSPSCGNDGPEIGGISTGTNQRIGPEIVMDSLSDEIWIPPISLATSAIHIGGHSCTLHFDGDNSSNIITIDIEYSTDGVTWVDIPGLQVNDAVEDITEVTKNLGLQAEYVRLVIDASSIGDGFSANFRACF